MTCFCGTYFCYKCGDKLDVDHGACSCRPRGYGGFDPGPQQRALQARQVALQNPVRQQPCLVRKKKKRK